MFVRRGTSETFFIGRLPRLPRAAALEEIAQLLEQEGQEERLRTLLARELLGARADHLTRDELASALADGVAAGHLTLIGARPRFAWTPPLGESDGPAGEEQKPPEEQPEEKWLELELVDDGDPPQPVAGARYVVELKDGSVIEGKLDDSGKARVEGIKKGDTAKISFPDVDAADWK